MGSDMLTVEGSLYLSVLLTNNTIQPSENMMTGGQFERVYMNNCIFETRG